MCLMPTSRVEIEHIYISLELCATPDIWKLFKKYCAVSSWITEVIKYIYYK